MDYGVSLGQCQWFFDLLGGIPQAGGTCAASSATDTSNTCTSTDTHAFFHHRLLETEQTFTGFFNAFKVTLVCHIAKILSVYPTGEIKTNGRFKFGPGTVLRANNILFNTWFITQTSPIIIVLRPTLQMRLTDTAAFSR